MVSVISGVKVTTSVVLAGGLGTLLTPLTKYMPASMVPILNKPLIKHTLARLNANGLSNVIIAGSEGHHSPLCKQFYSKPLDLKNVRYMEDDRPRGTAGVLRDFRDQIGDEPFLVVSGSCFLANINLDDVLDFHVKKKSALTIVVARSHHSSLEDIKCSDDGMIQDIFRVHTSRKRYSLESVGIYIFSPQALDYVDSRLYFDIKEQLVPALRAHSLPVYAYTSTQFCKPIYSVKDYFDLHRALLINPSEFPYREDHTMIADGVWAGKNTVISPQAYILGPVLIGDDVVVERDTQIIGPAVIGNRCTLEKGAFVRESIVWDDTVIEKSSRLQYCIAEQGLRVTSGESYSNTVLVDDADAEDASLMVSDQAFHGITALNPSILTSQRRPIFLFFKRATDIVLSLFGILVLLPVLVFIALAIKINSPGPAFFKQKRSGKGGVDFEMLKFRTMVQDAEKHQHSLAAIKNIDGPMFKLANDPRVTRVGAFLRRTSLDELPQLMNVLHGEMSLVGPRPLVMDEMKCSPSWRDTRLRVKPGMTGLWQVSGRSEAHFHDWIRYDVHYVLNQSLWLDLKILFKTIKVVLKKAGAY